MIKKLKWIAIGGQSSRLSNKSLISWSLTTSLGYSVKRGQKPVPNSQHNPITQISVAFGMNTYTVYIVRT